MVMTSEILRLLVTAVALSNYRDYIQMGAGPEQTG